ncbi:apolipoprotein D-like [Periplaneta americana]|uniref:apolipoprotein D-like n=1 Tax=Periplaneta americana TaxID=6978 RepID=UPI0037E78A99
MYTKWVVALLLCWCGAGVVESTLTACPQVTPPSEFNVTGILGTWYEIYHFKTDFEDANETCSTDTLSLTPEGFIRADEYDFNVTTGTYEHDVHVSSLSDTSKLTMNITLEGDLYGVNLWILASDYNRYMVRWACFEITDNTIIALSSISSRQKTLDDDALHEVDAILARIGVNRSQYELEVQTNCPDPVRDNTVNV